MLDSAVLCDRFRGTLIGAAIGDAVGTRARRASSPPEGEPATELTFSATTQLMMAVADTIASAVRLSNAPETAAMAGALSGAYLGLSGIPANWASSIEHRDKLLALADDLLMLAMSEADSTRCIA